MRRAPWPSRVTCPPPSITTFGRLLKTRAVALIGIVTGAGPQLKVMIPPWATALTTAAEVQLAGVPVPTTWSGSEVSTRPADAGIGECPVGLPAAGRRRVDRRQLEGSLEERGHLASGDVALRAEPAATAARRDAGGRQPVDESQNGWLVGTSLKLTPLVATRSKRTREERGHLAAADEVVRAEASPPPQPVEMPAVASRLMRARTGGSSGHR